MEVDGMHSRGEVFERKMELDPFLVLVDGDMSDAFSSGVLELHNHLGLFGPGLRSDHGNRKRDRQANLSIHERSFREKTFKDFQSSPETSALYCSSLSGTTESLPCRTSGDPVNNALCLMSASAAGLPMGLPAEMVIGGIDRDDLGGAGDPALAAGVIDDELV